MRVYRNLTEAVVAALHEIFVENRYADKVIEKVLKQNPKWGARDRRFIAETTYDIVRWYRLFTYLTDAGDQDYWKLVGAWCVWNKIDLPGWDEFKGLDRRAFLAKSEEAKSITTLRESIPDWLDDLGRKELGSMWQTEIHALNEQAKVVLRVNLLKISVRSCNNN